MKKGNILFLVLFIMFVSSLLGLLISEYVQNMIKLSSLFSRYYHTYYLAYGGLEVGLTQTKYHGYGFEDALSLTGRACHMSGCQVDMTVSSRSRVIADTYEQRNSCSNLTASGGTTHTYTVLWSGDCFITPLFMDAATGFSSIAYNEVTSNEMGTMNPALYNQYTGMASTGETYTVRVLDENLTNTDIVESTVGAPSPLMFYSSLSGYASSSGNKNYLIVANPAGTTKEFCMQLATGQELVLKYVNVTSIAVDGVDTVALSAIKNNELPSFLCYGAINP